MQFFPSFSPARTHSRSLNVNLMTEIAIMVVMVMMIMDDHFIVVSAEFHCIFSLFQKLKKKEKELYDSIHWDT